MSHMQVDAEEANHGIADNVRNPKAIQTPSKSWKSIVLLSLIIILGAALRFYDLGVQSYWNDEFATLIAAQQGVEQNLDLGQWARPPAYYLIAHFWLEFFGTSETATRFLSALFGIASVPLIFLVARELFGKRIGLLSAFLMAVSEFQIYYSQETRFYSLFGLMTLLSFFLFIRALTSGRKFHFVLYVVATILLFYSHAFGVFVLAAQNLYFFLRWKRLRRDRLAWFVCQTLILLAIAPALIAILWNFMRMRGLTAGKVSITDSPLLTTLHSVYWFIFPLRRERTWSIIGVNYIGGAIFLIIGILGFARWKGKEIWLASLKGLGGAFRTLSSTGNELLLVGCWLVCPIVLTMVLSPLYGPMYERYIISAAPAFYLLLALGISTIRRVVPELVSIGLLTILIAPGLQNYYMSAVKEQWREAAAYVAENTEMNDVIVFAPDQEGLEQKAFYWYYKGDMPGCDVNLSLKDDAEIADGVSECTSGHERFWLIIRHFSAGDRFKDFYLNHKPEGTHLLGEREFLYIDVFLFKKDIE